jgi:Spy/CpxP family protein refolding chaperone
MTESRHLPAKRHLAAAAIAALALLVSAMAAAADSTNRRNLVAEATPESSERGRAGAESADEAAAYLTRLKKCGRLATQEKQACVEAARDRLRQL